MKPRIILAEDDKLIHVVYQKILGAEGYELSCHGTCAAALADYNECPADLVIIDMAMPDMDGHELCQEIRKRPDGARVPVIMVSGHDDEENIMKGLNAGANDYLLKPIKPAELKAKIRPLLDYASGPRRDVELARNHAVLFNKYRLEKLISSKAHSSVFLARDINAPENEYAAKAVNDNSSEDKELLGHYIANLERLSRLDCPYIIKLFETGWTKDRFFLVMEFAANGSLLEIIRANGRVTPRQAITIGGHVTAALRALNSVNMNHMDVKPDNILLVNGVYKLGDLSLSMNAPSDTARLDQELWSTPDYLSPETINGSRAPDVKGDIYALGVTLYHALTGENPFHRDNAAKAMYAQLNEPAPPLRETAPDVPADLADIIASMLSKSPAERPDLETLADAFQRLETSND